MKEREASTRLMNILLKDKAFIELLSVAEIDGEEIPMMIFSPLLPDSWKITDKTVNIYTVSNACRLEYNRFRFRASCRSNTYAESRDLALAMVAALNRYYVAGFFITTTVLQTVNPSDAAVENFNTPVEILVRST